MKFLPIPDRSRPSAVFDAAGASIYPYDRPVRERLGPWRKSLRRLGASDRGPDVRSGHPRQSRRCHNGRCKDCSTPAPAVRSAISADMNKLPRGRGHRVWPDYAQRNRRLPSQYQANAIRLSLDVVSAGLPIVQQAVALCQQRRTVLLQLSAAMIDPTRALGVQCTSPNDRVAGAAGGPYAGTPFAPGPA